MPPSMIPLVLLSACRVVFQCASNWSHEAALCGTWLLSTVMLHVRRWQAFHLVVKLSGEKLCLTSPRQATQSNHCNRAVIHIYVCIYMLHIYIHTYMCVCVYYSESLYQISQSSSTLTWTDDSGFAADLLSTQNT